MNKESTSEALASIIWGIVFWSFIATKWLGTTFAAWSWWWALLPIVPWCGYAVQRFHL